MQAAQAQVPLHYSGALSRLVIAALCYAQPLVRSAARYKTRLFFFRVGAREPAPVEGGNDRVSLFGFSTRKYWTEGGCDRIELLKQVAGYLEERRWGKTIELPWSDSDLQIHCHPWTMLHVRTVQEEHGQGKRLICINYRVRTTKVVHLISLVGLAATLLVASVQLIPAAAMVLALALVVGRAWWRGNRLASQAVRVFDDFAERLSLVRCLPPEQRGLELTPGASIARWLKSCRSSPPPSPDQSLICDGLREIPDR